MSNPKSKPRRTRVPGERGIYRRYDGAFEIGFRDAEGKQRWQKVDGGIMAARAALAEQHAKRARGERIAADPRLSFNAAADAWWEARVLKLRPTTQAGYAAALKHLRRPEHFGRSRVRDITPTDVARYVTLQRAAGLKGWTVKGHINVLSSVFTYASRHLGHQGANPVALLDRVERPTTDDEKPKRILAADELARLLAAVDDGHRLLFELAAETGARLGEVLGLTWERVDLADQTITITHQLDRRRQLQPLKTKRSRRCLEITPALAAKLRERRMASPFSQPADFVFASRAGGGLDHRNVAGRVLARAVRDAGLEAVTDRHGSLVTPAPTFHALRHSHASALIAAGWDIAEVSARLGHASIATTQSIYVHQFDAARRSSDRRNRLAAMYGVEADVEAADRSRPQPVLEAAGGNVALLGQIGGMAQ